MRLSEAKSIIKFALTKQLELAKDKTVSHSRKIVPYLQGKVGIGKSSIVYAAAAELSEELGLKIYVKIINLAIYDPAEIAGWLMPDKEVESMKRLDPDWVNPVDFQEGDYDTIIYFFDEAVQAIGACQNIMGQILQERRIGNHYLPENSAIVGAGNRMEDRAGTNPMPTQIKDRFMFLNVDENLEDTLAYAVEDGWSEKVVAFLGFKPEKLHVFDHDADSNATPRTWERVSETVSNWGMPQKLERLAVAGLIGEATTADFYAFLAVYDVIPNIDDLIKNPMTAAIPDRADVVYAVCASLASKANPDNIGNIIKYIGRLDAGEYGAFVIKGAISKIPNPRQNKHLREWAENGGGADLLL